MEQGLCQHLLTLICACCYPLSQCEAREACESPGPLSSHWLGTCASPGRALCPWLRTFPPKGIGGVWKGTSHDNSCSISVLCDISHRKGTSQYSRNTPEIRVHYWLPQGDGPAWPEALQGLSRLQQSVSSGPLLLDHQLLPPLWCWGDHAGQHRGPCVGAVCLSSTCGCESATDTYPRVL